MSAAQLGLPTAPSALSALLLYLSLSSDPDNFGCYTISTHDLSQFMRLDASALRALNLVEGPSRTVLPSIVLHELLLTGPNVGIPAYNTFWSPEQVQDCARCSTSRYLAQATFD